ncbi:MAG TPA: hypothetical protein VFZ59_04485 [Verrucomicrobiae bacterium]|nr:hypothetical protein [Verrucomicrobiae bacterium]
MKLIASFAITALSLSYLIAGPIPRAPMWPPLPELAKVTHRESFDEVYFAGVSNAVVTIPNYGALRASWSGYSLERVGVVTPFVISGLGETGRVQVATDQGALRFWFRPYWNSGTGPGASVRLAELAAVEGSQAAVLWLLRVTADGTGSQLLGPGGSGVLLAADIDWSADSWHQIVLNYGTNGTELVLDGELVTKGDATLAVPASVTRLVMGSTLTGEFSAGGELEEVYCFGRPLRLAFHYLPFASIAATGPMSEEELAYRQELMEKWKALKAEQAKASEESGGGMEMLRLGGPSANCVTNGPVYLTNVLANFTTNDGWTVYFDIAGGTNGVVYDIFSTLEFVGNDITNSIWTWLETGMTCETHYYTNQPTNQVFYILTVPGADRDGDGLYDGWEWKHFGTLEQTASGDFDGDGVSNEDAHTSDDNPNNLRFSIVVTNNYVRTSALPVTLGMVTGKAETMAVLVDNTNLQSAVWTTFATNSLVSFAATEGWHDVRFGLRGHCVTNEVWRTLQVKYDVTPPVVVLTNPDLNGGNKPIIQLRGYGNELLGDITYDISNAAGVTTNQAGWVTAQDYTTNGFAFITNHFQCYDVSLADGTNAFSLRIADLAGNTTTTNFAHVLDASSDVTPPLITLKWPQNGQALSGSNFVVNGVLDDSTATMNAEVIDANGLTNKAAASVGRSGMFWTEPLPLMPGTNLVHLVATDYKGNSSSTNILLTKSAVTLTVGQVSPEEPLQFRASVTGTIDTAGLDVWVNGTLATVSNGTWQAVNVPLNVNNVRVMLVQAYPTGSNPLTTPSTAELREVSSAPPRVQQTGWYFNQHSTATLQDLSSGFFFLETEISADHWTEGIGGEKKYYRRRQFLVSGNTFECTNYASLPTNMMGLIEGFPIQDTCYGLTNATLNPYLLHFENVVGSDFSRVDATTTLFANGQDIPGATRAVLLKVQASGYDGAFTPEEMLLDGKPLSPSAEDPFTGEAIVTVAQGATRTVAPQVPSALDYFNWFFQTEELKVRVYLGSGTNDIAGKTNTVIVGQKIELRCELSHTNVPVTSVVSLNCLS